MMKAVNLVFLASLILSSAAFPFNPPAPPATTPPPFPPVIPAPVDSGFGNDAQPTPTLPAEPVLGPVQWISQSKPLPTPGCSRQKMGLSIGHFVGEGVTNGDLHAISDWPYPTSSFKSFMKVSKKNKIFRHRTIDVYMPASAQWCLAEAETDPISILCKMNKNRPECPHLGPVKMGGYCALTGNEIVESHDLSKANLKARASSGLLDKYSGGVDLYGENSHFLDTKEGIQTFFEGCASQLTTAHTTYDGHQGTQGTDGGQLLWTESITYTDENNRIRIIYRDGVTMTIKEKRVGKKKFNTMLAEAREEASVQTPCTYTNMGRDVTEAKDCTEFFRDGTGEQGFGN